MDLTNKVTKDWIDAYIAKPNEPLLINTNDSSNGGKQIYEYVYSSLSESSKTPLYIIEKQEKNSIGIEEVREALKHISLKADNNYKYSRFILIKNAELLTEDAQNAVLKQIEELPERTIFMLAASNLDSILETIVSRCYLVDVLPVNSYHAMEYADKLGIDRKIAIKAYSVSEGNSDLYLELLNNDSHILYDLLNTAKEFISSSIYDRQSIVKDIISDKEKVYLFVNTLQLISRTAMRNAKSHESKILWKNKLTEIIKTKNNLEKNVQTKLAILSLSVSI